jgi:hypothetical protein
MTSESIWYIIKALATTLDGVHERISHLEAEIAGMGQNQRDDLGRDFATIIAGLHRLSGSLDGR